MAQFDRLPLPMQMRIAARVIRAAGQRRCNNPLTTWGPHELEGFAEKFDREDYEAAAKANTCKGFRWVGQSFKHCEGCGRPFWEHTYDTRMRDGAGPFDEDPFEYVLITDEQKAACRAKWDR